MEPVWSHLKRSLANLAKRNLSQLAALVKTRLVRDRNAFSSAAFCLPFGRVISGPGALAPVPHGDYRAGCPVWMRETAARLEAVVTVGGGELTVEVSATADTDDEELAQLTNRLRDELLRLDVDAVSSARGGEAPDSSKGVGLLAAGGLVVRFALRQDLLRSIIDGIRSWLGRQHARSVKLTLDGDLLELTGVSSAEQDRLVELWVMRHGGAA